MEQEKKKRLIVIDGNALVHRAYHALPPLTIKKGELVNAVYGFLLVFFRVLKEFQPDYVVATFDLPGPTFRHKKFKEYKAKRVKAPDDLYEQIPKIKNILREFNIPIFEKQGFEADDLIGTIAFQAPRKQAYPAIETIIVTGDLDALQLINKNTKVFALRRGIKDAVLYDKEKVEERYGGVKPEQMADFKGLKGDPSDNIPGVTGVGEKTAIKLIQQFGNLENLYKELEKENVQIQDSLKEKLLEYRDQALFSKTLATIELNVPIEFNLKNCLWKDFDKDKAIKILEDFEFHALIKRLFKEDKKDINSNVNNRNRKLF